MKEKIRYSEAFKLKVMEELRDAKWKSVKEVAAAYGIAKMSVYNWMHKLGFEHLKGRLIYVKTRTEADRVKELEAEVKRLRLALADEVLDHKIDEAALRLLAGNRRSNAGSYVAGGLALNHRLGTPRLSRNGTYGASAAPGRRLWKGKGAAMLGDVTVLEPSGIYNGHDKRNREMKKLASMFMALVATAICAAAPVQPSAALIHSHNDYAQKRPFWGAYEAGADSVEADVFLVDGELLVAHSRKDLKKGNTLRRLYLEPLRDVMRKNGGRARPDGKPLQLVIDLKSGKPALDALLTIIEQEGFRECFDIRKNPSAVKLSVGGDIAGIKDFLSYPDFVFFSVPSSRKIDDCQYKRVSWISDYARIYTKWRSGAMAECDKKKIRAAAARAHAKGVPYRLWGFPDHKEAWELALELGLDYINTDHPAAAASFLRGDGVRVNH